MSVQRYDVNRLDRGQRMASGALRVDSRPTRTGVLLYRRADGGVMRELRHPDEVFAPASLASMRGTPLTVKHPATPVTPANWKDHSVGHVGDDVARAEDHVSAPLVVQDAKTIQDVHDGALIELSCGYTCDLDETPGTFGGERYDAVQRNIRYNHVALLGSGEGRAGPTAAIRWDANDASAAWREDSKAMAKETIDGIEYETLTEPWGAALKKVAAGATKRADTAEGRIASLEKDLTKARADHKDATDPKKLAAAAAARVKFIADAKRHVKAWGLKIDADDPIAPDGESAGTMPAIDIMRGLVGKHLPGVDVSKASDDFVLGVWAGVSEAGAIDEEAEDEPLDAPLDGAAPPPRMDARTARSHANRQDTRDRPAPKRETVRDMLEKTDRARADAWKAPLTASTGKA